jgi:hypothetical protein
MARRGEQLLDSLPHLQRLADGQLQPPEHLRLALGVTRVDGTLDQAA